MTLAAMSHEGPTRTSPRMARVLERLAEGPGSRMTVPATEEDLRHLERALGAPLPPELRALLSDIGAGLYEHGHEVFGPSRVMIHDIELVPDMLSMRARLGAEGAAPGQVVPFHRGGGAVHVIRIAGPRLGEVLSLPPGATYPDLPTFIERVMFVPPPD